MESCKRTFFFQRYDTHDVLSMIRLVLTSNVVPVRLPKLECIHGIKRGPVGRESKRKIADLHERGARAVGWRANGAGWWSENYKTNQSKRFGCIYGQMIERAGFFVVGFVPHRVCGSDQPVDDGYLLWLREWRRCWCFFALFFSPVSFTSNAILLHINYAATFNTLLLFNRAKAPLRVHKHTHTHTGS